MIEIFLTLILIFAPIARGAVRIWAFAKGEEFYKNGPETQ